LVGIDHVAQLDMFSPLARQRRLEMAIDALATRFGTDVVSRANDFAGKGELHFAPTLDFLDDHILD
jgi:hypothetical protein